jgi:sporulation protein YlmC with PRC-barrel domain
MRAVDLQGKRVLTRSGRRRGRIDEIVVRDGEVTALVVGPAGLLQRFTAARRGRRIAWSKVLEVDDKAVIVDD